MSVQYFGQQLLFDDFQLILFTGSQNPSQEQYIPFDFLAVSDDATQKANVPIWKCRALIGLTTTGSQLQTGSITKVTFEIGHIYPTTGLFSGSLATATIYTNINQSGSGVGSTGSTYPIYGVARCTGSTWFDFNYLALRIRMYGGITGEDTPGQITLFHRRGLPDTYVEPRIW